MANYEVTASLTMTIFDVADDNAAEQEFIDTFPDVAHLITVEEVKELNV